MEELIQEYLLDKDNNIIDTKNVIYDKNLLGLNYFDFADDLTLIKILKDIFKKVREKRKIFITTYRCDNEKNMRLFELEIIPLNNGILKLIHKLIKETNRSIELDLEKRSSELFYLCAWCNRIKVGDNFIEIDDAVNKLKMLEYNYLPKFSHCMCEECKEKLLNEMEDFDK
ncbi:MAG: hypothetical protein GYA61_03800 [Spirochaetales bacterium]|nr:hypothetical protein [Spirochaetales bacterium]